MGQFLSAPALKGPGSQVLQAVSAQAHANQLGSYGAIAALVYAALQRLFAPNVQWVFAEWLEQGCTEVAFGLQSPVKGDCPSKGPSH